MQHNMAYISTGEYLNAKVDKGENRYVDVDVVPPESNQYEEIQDDPHRYEELRPKPSVTTAAAPADSNRRKEESTVEAPRPGCRRPPWWAWAVLVFCVIITATVVALLLVFLTNTTSTPGTSSSTTSTTGNLLVKSTTAVPTSYHDCVAAYKDGKTTSGVYSISPDGVTKVDVYCEQGIDGGGWTVFQRRIDGSLLFNRTWASYKNGFGIVNDEYWLGNEVIHLLTVNQDQKLKVELQNDGLTAYADYSQFWIKGEREKYQLHVGGFTNGQNEPGDSLSWHNEKYFSTHDADDGRNSAAHQDSAWWYNIFSQSDLNAPYGGCHDWWSKWTGHDDSLDATRMMVKTR